MTKLLKMALEGARSVKLYHYAEEEYPILMTKARTTEISPADIKKATESQKTYFDPGLYYEHISFFLEPAPFEKMSEVFGSEHPFWKPGNRIVEHVVLLKDLPAFKYRMVETDLCTQMFYDPALDAMELSKYVRLLYERQKKAGEIGDDPEVLTRLIEQSQGQTEAMYRLLPTRSNWDQIKRKYAATVPHVMVYPEGGQINVHSSREVTVR